ncbi:Neoverrucotoxin subunit beta, partial [Hondaea fermentalgiana]
MSQQEKLVFSRVLGEGSHVIEAIDIEANAFVTFTYTFEAGDDREALSGSLKAVINSIPTMEIDADAALDKLDYSAFKKERLSFKYVGDVILPETPTSPESAFSAVKYLGKKLYEDADSMQGLPVAFRAMPICHYSGQSDTVLLRLISD